MCFRKQKKATDQWKVPTNPGPVNQPTQPQKDRWRMKGKKFFDSRSDPTIYNGKKEDK
jgi:hypothetical protein